MGKKENTHKMLAETAIDLFIRKRSSNVSLDEVADGAGVARRTIYYHFANKEALVLEITEPILSDGLSFLREIARKERILLADIAELCLFLWRNYGQSLNLLYNIDLEDFQALKDLHSEYLSVYTDVFSRIGDLPDDLQDFKMEIASLVFRSFVTLLAKTEKMDDRENRFRSCLEGMVSGLSLT